MSTRAPRFPADYPVVIRADGELYASTICNISVGGACLLGIDWASNGTVMVIDYALGQTRATVTWTTGKMAGVKFEDMLSDACVQSIRTPERHAS